MQIKASDYILDIQIIRDDYRRCVIVDDGGGGLLLDRSTTILLQYFSTDTLYTDRRRGMTVRTRKNLLRYARRGAHY